uniref:Uncharacterized protein n=1 Tax=Arundo donax TaxID=35708 RepID=A0A0A9AYX0_ARUDO
MVKSGRVTQSVIKSQSEYHNSLP